MSNPIEAVTSIPGKVTHEASRFNFWLAFAVIAGLAVIIVIYVASVRSRVLAYLQARDMVYATAPAAATLADNPVQPSPVQLTVVD